MTLVVAIDGPAGSGKTTLAARLATVFGSAPVVHMDDLYDGWEEDLHSSVRRLVDQVLSPLAAGRVGCYQRYDWAAGRFGSWVEVPAAGVVVVEGCGCGAGVGQVPQLRSLLIWVEADDEVRLKRGIARDGVRAREQWRRWMIRERAFFAADHTFTRADVHFDGDGHVMPPPVPLSP